LIALFRNASSLPFESSIGITNELTLLLVASSAFEITLIVGPSDTEGRIQIGMHNDGRYAGNGHAHSVALKFWKTRLGTGERSYFFVPRFAVKPTLVTRSPSTGIVHASSIFCLAEAGLALSVSLKSLIRSAPESARCFVALRAIKVANITDLSLALVVAVTPNKIRVAWKRAAMTAAGEISVGFTFQAPHGLIALIAFEGARVSGDADTHSTVTDVLLYAVFRYALPPATLNSKFSRFHAPQRAVAIVTLSTGELTYIGSFAHARLVAKSNQFGFARVRSTNPCTREIPV
jgi:hypothetical protein